jgi:hypothetical protein
MAREILSKRNFFDFESPDSAISRFPMTLMKSMVSLHQGPKVSKAKPLNMKLIIIDNNFFYNKTRNLVAGQCTSTKLIYRIIMKI